MGIYLNSKGGLTVSQRIQADSMGMPHEEFKQQLIDRLLELRGGRTPKTERMEKMKRNIIHATNPVLMIAGGPSYKENIERIRKFPNKIIAVDVTFNNLVQNDIIPDYVITLESSKRIINEGVYLADCLLKCKDKTTIVGSSITTDNIIKHVRKYGVRFERWNFAEEPRASNVGVYGIAYAYNELKADKIILIGFEHTGSNYPQSTYLTWQTDFWYFIRKWPKETIVNCTDGGALYYEDYILDTSLEKLIIN